MTSYRDWVVETSSTTGTGAYSLSGSAPAGTSYFTFRQRYSNGETKLVYWVVNANRTKWEKNRFGTLTYGSPDMLSRNVVESTHGDAPVSWVGGDGPLRLYVVPDAAAEEFAITMGLGATRPGVLRYGVWSDENGLATNYDLVNLYDGTSDDPVGVVNRIAHRATLYGLPPGHLHGLTLSRSSATVLGIAAGVSMDSTNVVGIRLASAFTKSTAGAWAVGSGSNGMGNALTIANNTWYHVFAILNAGAADVYIDTSVAAANKPTNTTHFRRIGSFRTNGSAQIIDFTQDGDLFLWSAIVDDVTAGNPGLVAVLRTMSVPLGVNVRWYGKLGLDSAETVNGSQAGLAMPGITPDFQTPTALNAAGGVASFSGPPFFVRTNAASQVNSLVFTTSTANVTLRITTHGWLDRRGRDS